jgi:tetratricopeptide (TPR) repeat protein
MKNLVFSLFALLFFTISYAGNSAGNIDKPDEPKKSHCSPEKTTDIDWYSSGTKAPKFKGLDGINFPVTTTNLEAKQYFDQGMMLAFGFNHAEAARSFYEAMRLDPSCAMCHWGYAYVLGPNYNMGMDPGNFERAYDAATKAVSLSSKASALEKTLINALLTRYAKDPPADRGPLDLAYSQAMKKVYQIYPDNPDVAALYAESLMDLHPWDLYDKATKEPKEWTPEIVNVIEHILETSPNHAGANHYYIHAVEASKQPEKGLPSAKALETLVPGAGHLVHMPSHIYINTGDYHLGSESNINALKVDNDYVDACHAQGAYPLVYFPHNYHFLAATATLEGNSKDAWMAAKEMHEWTSNDNMKLPGWGVLQHYHTIPYYIAIKFAMWDSVLSLPMPDKELVYPNAILHYARGIARLGQGNVMLAGEELMSLKGLIKDTSLNMIIWSANSIHDLLDIAVYVLSGEIAAAKGKFDEATDLLSKAVAIEDKLTYTEPPDWFFSIRHNLGNVLLKSGRYAEAETAYREDLLTWKKSGWALYGLHIALLKQGKSDEAQLVKQQFETAWQHADYKLGEGSENLVSK